MTVDNATRPRVVAESAPAMVLNAYDLQARYLDGVLRYVSAFVRPPEEAEDVTMQVFHAAFNSLHKLRRGDDPRVWLLGIARRKAFDSLRSRYRRREDPLFTSQHLHGDRIAGVDQSLLVSQVLGLIPTDQAQALVLKYVNGLSIDEVGEAMGRSSKAANSLIQRARQSFQEKGADHFPSFAEVTK